MVVPQSLRALYVHRHALYRLFLHYADAVDWRTVVLLPCITILCGPAGRIHNGGRPYNDCPAKT